jgi:hypothetical protein
MTTRWIWLVPSSTAWHQYRRGECAGQVPGDNLTRQDDTALTSSGAEDGNVVSRSPTTQLKGWREH